VDTKVKLSFVNSLQNHLLWEALTLRIFFSHSLPFSSLFELHFQKKLNVLHDIRIWSPTNSPNVPTNKVKVPTKILSLEWDTRADRLVLPSFLPSILPSFLPSFLTYLLSYFLTFLLSY